MPRQLPNGWVICRDGLRPSDARKAKRAVAIHEAAHAVVAEVAGAKVQRLAITGIVTGFSDSAYRRRRGRTDPVARGVIALAGHEAEVRFCGRPMRMLPKQDYENVRNLGCSDDSVNALGEIARRLVRWYAPHIRRVARALMQRGRLSRRQFLAVYRGVA